MLRAGLIGFPSSGKTALFQLLTSAREAPRSGGKQEANVGVARVPDDRLDRLTVLFNPKKHVPATVEFADMGGAVGAKTGAAALLDVAPFRNADALLHVVRMFRDPSVPHASGSVDPARDVRAMEDEIILADLGVVERRLERLERDLKKAGSNTE
jgi:ribosome-binding ATPase YchF (GTP1/OBG family)